MGDDGGELGLRLAALEKELQDQTNKFHQRLTQAREEAGREKDAALKRAGVKHRAMLKQFQRQNEVRVHGDERSSHASSIRQSFGPYCSRGQPAASHTADRFRPAFR